MVDHIFCYRVPKGKTAGDLLDDLEDILRGAKGELVSQISPRALEAYRTWHIPLGIYSCVSIHIKAENGYRYWRDRRKRCSAYVYLRSVEDDICGIGGIEGELARLELKYPVMPYHPG